MAAPWIAVLAFIVVVAYVSRARDKNSRQPQSVEKSENRVRVAAERADMELRLLKGAFLTEHKLGFESSVAARTINDVLAKRLLIRDKETIEAEVALRRLKALTDSNGIRRISSNNDAGARTAPPR
jgi:hypothetical protein